MGFVRDSGPAYRNPYITIPPSSYGDLADFVRGYPRALFVFCDNPLYWTYGLRLHLLVGYSLLGIHVSRAE